jgi:hypothetical protein
VKGIRFVREFHGVTKLNVRGIGVPAACVSMRAWIWRATGSPVKGRLNVESKRTLSSTASAGSTGPRQPISVHSGTLGKGRA